MATRRSPYASGLVSPSTQYWLACRCSPPTLLLTPLLFPPLLSPSPPLPFPSPPFPFPPTYAGFVTCLLSLLAGVILGLFDLRAEKLLKRKEGKVGEVIRLKDILRFPLSLWLVFAICVLYYVTVFPFIGLAM